MDRIELHRLRSKIELIEQELRFARGWIETAERTLRELRCEPELNAGGSASSASPAPQESATTFGTGPASKADSGTDTARDAAQRTPSAPGHG